VPTDTPVLLQIYEIVTSSDENSADHDKKPGGALRYGWNRID